MFTVSACRSGDGSSHARRALFIAPVVALAIVFAGCTAAPDTSATPEPEGTSTTDWTPPADPDAQGPTAAPALTEETGALDAEIALSTDMVVTVDDISTTEITPKTPGEYAGSAVVSLVTDDGDVGVATTAGPNEPLHGELAAGDEATGTYVFMLDPTKGRAVKISVNYAAGEPVAVFAGKLS